MVDKSTAPPEGRRKTHKQLSIIAGSVRAAALPPRNCSSLALTPPRHQAANYKLWSPEDMNTRPMMASVRGAVFSMLTSLAHGNGQTAGTFPPVRFLCLRARMRATAWA